MNTTKYKNITVGKISDHGGTAKTPTHQLVVSDEKFQNKKTAGKLWTKESNYGKYLAGNMEKTRTYEKGEETIQIIGFSIVSDEYLEFLESLVENKSSPKEKQEENIDLNDIPF